MYIAVDKHGGTIDRNGAFLGRKRVRVAQVGTLS
jgi:hypothetical protein